MFSTSPINLRDAELIFPHKRGILSVEKKRQDERDVQILLNQDISDNGSDNYQRQQQTLQTLQSVITHEKTVSFLSIKSRKKGDYNEKVEMSMSLEQIIKYKTLDNRQNSYNFGVPCMFDFTFFSSVVKFQNWTV